MFGIQFYYSSKTRKLETIKTKLLTKKVVKLKEYWQIMDYRNRLLFSGPGSDFSEMLLQMGWKPQDKEMIQHFEAEWINPNENK